MDAQMSELDPNEDIQNAPGEEQSTQVDWDSADNPWKRNFDEYRVEADRRATKLSAYESYLEDLRSDDPERQRRAAEGLGVELVEDESEYVDPTTAQLAAMQRKQEQLEQQLTAQSKELEQERMGLRIEAKFDALKLDESDRDWVLARAVAVGAGEDGMPNIDEAYRQLVARDEEVMRKWESTKRRAPGSIAPGSTGTDAKNIADMTDEERVEWAVQRLEHSA